MSEPPFRIPSPAPAIGAIVERVDRALSGVLDEIRISIGREASEAAVLAQDLRTTVLAGGKRLRPVLCILGYRAGGSPEDDRILRAACAVELVHTFALIQDDVMDGAATRRGRPALHARPMDEPAGGTPGSERGPLLGEARALLVADLALVSADRLLSTCGLPAERILDARGPYDGMRLDAVAGQYLDLSPPDGEADDEEQALRVGALKTGRYSVEGPIQVGAALAGAGDDARQALRRFGAPLGRAFQVRDDVLGAFGDPGTTGKDASGDLRHGKRTVLVAKALQTASVAERRFLEARLGRPDLTDGEVQQIREVMRDSGALDATVAMIRDLIEEATAALADPAIHGDARGDLTSVAEMVSISSS